LVRRLGPGSQAGSIVRSSKPGRSNIGKIEPEGSSRPEGIDGRFWQLRSADVSDELVQMVAGGQPGEYAARFVTSRADAIRAATEFAATGERAPLGWEQT